MAEEKDADRFFWNDDDLVIFDKDGNEISAPKKKQEKEERIEKSENAKGNVKRRIIIHNYNG